MMYILVKNDAEFIQVDPNNGKLDMPLGYPCLFCLKEWYGDWQYCFVYVPPDIKCLNSFIVGVNAAC